MPNSNNRILTIDLSSNKIKVGLVSDDLKLTSFRSQDLEVLNEDIDGFAKYIDTDAMWSKIEKNISDLLKQEERKGVFDIIGISSCAQRMAVVFLDHRGEVIYCSPNTDVRGIDSAFLIEDEFSEEDLFKITGHSPSILFCLSRLLWFKEEKEESYNKIKTVLTLDDWIVYKLTGEFCTDLSSAGETQLLDITKGKWSSEIIEAFDFDPDFFPEIVDSGEIIGDLETELIKKLGIKHKKIPVVKSGGDTQASLLGMGAIEDGNVGITLGSTAPVHFVVNKPILDPQCNYWTTFHSIKDKWIIEGNSGNTGIVFDWFKESFLRNGENANELIESYLKKTAPGAGSTFAFLGPEIMNIKDQVSLKRGVFVFPPPTLITEEVPKIENFARCTLENIGFGIYENYNALNQFLKLELKTFCAGGMAKSNEFCKILSNILETPLTVPHWKDSAFIGLAMNTLIGIKLYSNYKKLIKNSIDYDYYSVDSVVSKKYREIYLDWYRLKKKVDDL